MENMGVIERVYEPTDWVNATAFSRKRSGELRICLDPKLLNKFIKRTYYKTSTLEENSHKPCRRKALHEIRRKSWILGNSFGRRI